MLTRLRERDDAGLSLAELIVSMTLMSILLMVGGTFLVTSMQSTNKSTLTNQQTAGARLTLDSWTTKLRVATFLDTSQTDRIEVMTPNKIVFYANLGNRSTTDFSVGAVSKVVLMLKQTDTSTGYGQLIQIIFRNNTSTPTSVERIALNARAAGGKGTAVFTGYNYIGSEVNPASYNGCKSGATVKPGLCLQTLPTGAGMVDPTVGLTSNTVTAGTYGGNSALNVDSILQSIVAVKIGFTVSDSAHTVSQTYQSMAALNSGYAS